MTWTRMQSTPPWIIILLVGNPKKKPFQIAPASKFRTAFCGKIPMLKKCFVNVFCTVSCGLMGREGSNSDFLMSKG